MDGAHIHVWYAPNTDETAKKISDSLGVTTEIHQQVNYTGGRLSGWLGHVMVSNQETARPLMTPGEVRELPKDDEIVVVAGMPPIRAKKVKYWTDPGFSQIVPPTYTEGPNAGKVKDYSHTYAPPLDTDARPYRYGPPVPASCWAGLVATASAPAALAASAADGRDLDPTPKTETAIEAAPAAAVTAGVEAPQREAATPITPAPAAALGLDAAGGQDDIDWSLP